MWANRNGFAVAVEDGRSEDPLGHVNAFRVHAERWIMPNLWRPDRLEA
jgi:hypothetical protein